MLKKSTTVTMEITPIHPENCNTYVITNRVPVANKPSTCDCGAHRNSRKRRTHHKGGDVLRTVMRDLHGVRTSLLDRESRRVTLERVDTLMDELENYMAEN